MSHGRYLSNIFSCNRGHKGFWSYIKSKRRDQVSIPSLEINGTTISDTYEKVDLINHQFSSVFTQEDLSTIPDLGLSPYDGMSIDDITVEGVSNLLANLQGHEAHGPDNIPARLLKETAVNIAPILTLAFKASLHQCTLSLDWKSAPIFKKKGSRKCPHNYRPISLTSIPCWVFEHIIYSSI